MLINNDYKNESLKNLIKYYLLNKKAYKKC